MRSFCSAVLPASEGAATNSGAAKARRVAENKEIRRDSMMIPETNRSQLRAAPGAGLNGYGRHHEILLGTHKKAAI